VTLFAGRQTKAEILQVLSEDDAAYDNVLAAANVGMAFMLIARFERHLATLITISATKLKANHVASGDVDASVFLKRHDEVSSSTMGKLVRLLEASGIEGKEKRYLKALVEIRNNFIHHFQSMVPLPGDWERHGFSLEDFSRYTKFVTRRFHFASNLLPYILAKAELLHLDGDPETGYFSWHPDHYADIFQDQ
jgi:hypothetical protein